MSYEHPNEFLNLDSTQVDNIVNVNITSLNVMTRIILPQMVERKKGAVINISSLSGMMVSPMLAVSIFTRPLSVLSPQDYSVQGVLSQSGQDESVLREGMG